MFALNLNGMELMVLVVSIYLKHHHAITYLFMANVTLEQLIKLLVENIFGLLLEGSSYPCIHSWRGEFLKCFLSMPKTSNTPIYLVIHSFSLSFHSDFYRSNSKSPFFRSSLELVWLKNIDWCFRFPDILRDGRMWKSCT